MIRVQREDIDIGAALESLAAGNHRIGGVASFVGLVRDIGGADRVSALTLEHYSGMTEKKLAEIETEAHRRWPLDAVLIIHRYGRLEPGDRIVLVATASPHRAAALPPSCLAGHMSKVTMNCLATCLLDWRERPIRAVAFSRSAHGFRFTS